MGKYLITWPGQDPVSVVAGRAGLGSGCSGGGSGQAGSGRAGTRSSWFSALDGTRDIHCLTACAWAPVSSSGAISAGRAGTGTFRPLLFVLF